MGTRDAARSRSNAQWYEPCVFDEGGNSTGSLTVPLMIGPPGTYRVVELALTCNADRKTLRPVAEVKVLGSVERKSTDEAIVAGGVNEIGRAHV